MGRQIPQLQRASREAAGQSSIVEPGQALRAQPALGKQCEIRNRSKWWPLAVAGVGRGACDLDTIAGMPDVAEKSRMAPTRPE